MIQKYENNKYYFIHTIIINISWIMFWQVLLERLARKLILKRAYLGWLLWLRKTRILDDVIENRTKPMYKTFDDFLLLAKHNNWHVGFTFCLYLKIYKVGNLQEHQLYSLVSSRNLYQQLGWYNILFAFK